MHLPVYQCRGAETVWHGRRSSVAASRMSAALLGENKQRRSTTVRQKLKFLGEGTVDDDKNYETRLSLVLGASQK